MRRQLGKGGFEMQVRSLAFLIRRAFENGQTTTLFGLEGVLRHGLRAGMCRDGWGWSSADLMACDLLSEALKAARAVRPGWDEGQPEWAINTGPMIERTMCVRCKVPLPEGHFKFCGPLCASAHFSVMESRKNATEDEAYDRVVKFNGRKYVA